MRDIFFLKLDIVPSMGWLLLSLMWTSFFLPVLDLHADSQKSESDSVFPSESQLKNMLGPDDWTNPRTPGATEAVAKIISDLEKPHHFNSKEIQKRVFQVQSLSSFGHAAQDAIPVLRRLSKESDPRLQYLSFASLHLLSRMEKAIKNESAGMNSVEGTRSISSLVRGPASQDMKVAEGLIDRSTDDYASFLVSLSVPRSLALAKKFISNDNPEVVFSSSLALLNGGEIDLALDTLSNFVAQGHAENIDLKAVGWSMTHGGWPRNGEKILKDLPEILEKQLELRSIDEQNYIKRFLSKFR